MGWPLTVRSLAMHPCLSITALRTTSPSGWEGLRSVRHYHVIAARNKTGSLNYLLDEGRNPAGKTGS